MSDAGAPMDMGKWKGLFDWSMKFQDGTRPSEYSAEQLTPEKREWLDKALHEMMKDFAERLQEITKELGDGDGADTTASLAEKEALCDELLEIVESVDSARDLHKIGGLRTLLALMSSPHPSLRWRAAEITATCMANNPPVQRWFMDGGALGPLLGLLADGNVAVQTKAVLALSALVRHYDPGLEAFRLQGGLQKLLALLGCATDPAVAATPAAEAAAAAAAAAAAEGEAAQQQQQQQQQPPPPQQQQRRRLERKVLALLQYLLAKHPADCGAAAQFGTARELRGLLADGDSDMRQASLAVLSELVSTPAGWSWVREHEDGLVPQLQRLAEQHERLPPEDREAEAEEGSLLAGLLRSLRSDTAPAGGGAGLQDHVELDPYQDGRERAGPQTLSLRGGGGGGGGGGSGSGAQQQPPQQSAEQQGLGLLAVPQPDLR